MVLVSSLISYTLSSVTGFLHHSNEITCIHNFDHSAGPDPGWRWQIVQGRA